MRSAIKVEKFGAKADSALHTENPANATTSTFLRLWREETSTRNGPQIATINANKPINQPAWDTVTPKRSTITGRMPTTPNSRVYKPKRPSMIAGMAAADLVRFMRVAPLVD